jgi:hypothetical protein
VDVEDLVPFLVIGGISAARRLLAIGANLSLNEAQHVEPQGGDIGAGLNLAQNADGAPRSATQAMIP